MRLLAKQLKEHAGERVTIRGWLHKKRLLGGLTFIVLRDRSGVVQVLVKDKGEVEKLRGLQIGTILTVNGIAAADDRAPGGIEIHETSVKVDVPVEFESPIEIDKPLSHESDNLDTLFDYRVVGLRNIREQAVFKIQSEVMQAFRQYMQGQEFTEIKTPKLLPGATEGGAEVFKLDYFGKEATLAQSPQFYKEMMVGVFERVYEIGPVYRAELSATTRHMTEYTSVDAEMGFIEFKDLLELLSGMLNAVVDQVWDKCEPELNAWGANKPKLTKQIPTITMDEVHKLYSEATGENSIGEKDMRPDEERWVCEYAAEKLDSEAVFIVGWPREGAKFYHKFEDDNPDFAVRTDLLFRGVEIVTASMREHRYDVLVKQLQEMAGGKPDDPGFANFLAAFKYGMPPLGGFGMGLERLTQKIIGLQNVKEATLFPRDINRLAP